MNESVVTGMQGMELNGGDAEIRKSSSIRRILVSGHDSSLDKYEVDKCMREIFVSCGEIIHVNRLGKCWCPTSRFALVYIRGEGAEEKALGLNGSDVGGWELTVKAYPFEEGDLDHPEVSARMRAGKSRLRMVVTGYNTWLSEADVDRNLNALLPCVTNVGIPLVAEGGIHSNAVVHISGEDSVEKALELSGTDVGGWTFVVTEVLPPRKIVIGNCRCGKRLKPN